MILKLPIYLTLLLALQTVTSQTKKVCEDPVEESLMDLNSISTKCTIETVKDASNKDQIQIQVTSRKRVVRKRNVAKGVDTHSNDLELTSIKENSSIVGDLDLGKEEIAEKMPFNNVEEIPLFKSCENTPIIEQKKCFNKEIAEHIRKNFTYPPSAQKENIQGRVLTQFVIDRVGNVTDLNIRGPYKGELLEEEAKRIINKLPRFTPGKHNGKTIKVKYGIPISFKIPGKEASNVKKEVELKEVINFNNVNQIPLFKSCIKTEDKEGCFNNELIKHVNKYFVYPEAAIDNNIQGKVLIYFVINQEGDIVNIKTRAPKGCEILEDSTVKLFEKLPQFTPGKHNGKPANVKHVFPLDFKLN